MCCYDFPTDTDTTIPLSASNEVTKDGLLSRSSELCRWIDENGIDTIPLPDEEVEEIEVSKPAFDVIQRLISFRGSATSLTIETTDDSHISAVMLYIVKHTKTVTDFKTVILLPKTYSQYKPRGQTNKQAVGLLSITYSAIRQMIEHLTPGPCLDGAEIIHLLGKLDGTLDTFDDGLKTIAKIRPLLGKNMFLLVNIPELLAMNELDRHITDRIRDLGSKICAPGLDTKMWFNVNTMDFTRLQEEQQTS
ncbi:hypothetical protein F5B20DRAFT_563064 [Whalleya microplaca]|nr:hypothetical protein F5B20DRAFT_563064 [Whalleya microplaca]